MTDENTRKQVFELYDDYCHDRIDRREFFKRPGALTAGCVAALALAQSMLPDYAQAETILLYRRAHQGAMGGLPVAWRQFGVHARLSGAAQHRGTFPQRARHS